MKQTIDARGIACPGPVIEAKKAFQTLQGGELTVLVDNDMAVQNLTKLGEYSHYPVTVEKEHEKSFKVTFAVSSGVGEALSEDTNKTGMGEVLAVAPEKTVAGEALAGTAKETVVVLSSDRMGTGEDELGRILMKGFVYALTQQEKAPDRVLLYNTGAYLSTEGSDSLEDLRLLEKNGAEVLTCGTCLNFYKIAEKLGVGGVTNLYAIAEFLTGADLIIRP
ncbi:MAG: sulfurtransferase-like selenium metabolism protein YedF [Lachnospiraceae bacterium]|nr:sulfurtransferase-like selenium metabolism protein YedF [Lachnospiraceae bacterium]